MRGGGFNSRLTWLGMGIRGRRTPDTLLRPTTVTVPGLLSSALQAVVSLPVK